MFHLLPLSRREVEGRPDLPLPWEAARTPAAAAAERFAYGALWETFLRGGYPEPSTYVSAVPEMLVDGRNEGAAFLKVSSSASY